MAQIDYSDGIIKMKNGVKKLITFLDAKIEFAPDDKTKTIIVNRRNAFMSASDMIETIFQIEEAENNGKVTDPDWYKDTISDLIDRGKSTIDLIFDGIASDIVTDTEERANADIIAKRDGAQNIDDMRLAIDKLNNILDSNRDGKNFKIEKVSDETIHDYTLKFAE